MSATYDHLRPAVGVDLSHVHPGLLTALNNLARSAGEVFTITSGYRSPAKQAQLVAHPQGYPVAAAGTSLHETGDAVDVFVAGQPIQQRFSAHTLLAAGLYPQPGDAVHVQDVPAGTTVAQVQQAQRKRGGGFDPLGALKGGAEGALGLLGLTGPDPVGAAKLAAKGVGDVNHAEGNLPQKAADATASAIVSSLMDAFGQEGAKLFGYTVLVGGAIVMFIVGLARATGVTSGDVAKGIQAAAVVPK